MKKISFILISLIIFSVGILLGYRLKNQKVLDEISKPQKVDRPLDKYSIENLSRTQIEKGNIEITEEIANKVEEFKSCLFSFRFDPTLTPKINKKMSGIINIPKNSEDSKYPVILMLRGYVDQKIYQSGTGTKNAAEYFAKNGFITVAPDFLGYGQSDSEAGNIFESRFQTYTTVLSLLSTFRDSSFAKATEDKWDGKNIFIWAHSNGGQIALTILEITGKSYPTVLWAPVSKPFPYSILYYTDESDDGGKLIRKELAKFEELYDTDLFSLTKYFDLINAPIQINQGTADDAVPVNWSDNLVQTLKKLDKDITYYKYHGADHNLKPDWNIVIEKDLKFFKNYLSKEL